MLDRWWPLLFSVAFAAAAAALGYLLSTKRDVGAGLVPARAGKDVRSCSQRDSSKADWRPRDRVLSRGHQSAGMQ